MEDRHEFISMEITSTIEASGLYRFYHDVDTETIALSDVSVRALPGELIAIVGPSGSGKSTLLSCLAGLDEPDAGHVQVGDQAMTRRPESFRAQLRSRFVGVLTQSDNLVSHLNVDDNLKVAQLIARKRLAQHRRDILSALEISGKAKSYLDELSGGEIVRVGLAVALINEPKVLLADEPTAELDSQTEQTVIDLIKQQLGSTRSAIVATHSEKVAARADKVLRLRDGRQVA